MSEKVPSDTRARILEAARDLFSQRGYQRTSIQQIAERLGLVKTAVLYHFPAKVDLLSALVEPLLDDWEAAVVDAARIGGPQLRWAVIEGVLDASLAHRHVMRMHLHDLAMLSHEPVFRRFVQIMTQQQQLVAGPAADLPGRIRAAQAIAMIGDPVVLFADEPTELLRAEVLSGVRRLLGEPTTGDAPTGRRGRGRPPAMDAAAVAAARLVHAAGGRTVDQIAAEFGVSRATLYRHLGSPISETYNET